MSSNGITDEFLHVDFGDKRLNRRLIEVSKNLYEAPMSSINEACKGWKDTKAAYRLFDNDKVDASEMLFSHRNQTMKRVSNEHTVLAIQDTTFFNYEHHESKEGLGSIQSRKVPTKGVLAHNTLITSFEGIPLGLADQKIYTRENKTKRSKATDPIETKESYRWIEALATLEENLPKDTNCIVVGDREADIYELMEGCLDRNFDFVVRSTHNRVVGSKQKRWGEQKNKNEYLIDYVAKQPVDHKAIIKVNDRKQRKIRVAHLNIRFCKVDFPAPWRIHDGVYDRPSLDSIYIVEAKEHHPPEKSEKIHWRIITSMQASSIEGAMEIISIYQKRWTIEIFHKVIKSGCRVEHCRLKTFEKIKRYLTLSSIIAWRLHWITKINQLDPNKPCTIAFSQQEWRAIYKAMNRGKPLPKQKPTIRDIVRWMAQLGGFLGRKSDKEPGITTIWRGWQALNNHLLIAYG